MFNNENNHINNAKKYFKLVNTKRLIRNMYKYLIINIIRFWEKYKIIF